MATDKQKQEAFMLSLKHQMAGVNSKQEKAKREEDIGKIVPLKVSEMSYDQMETVSDKLNKETVRREQEEKDAQRARFGMTKNEIVWFFEQSLSELEKCSKNGAKNVPEELYLGVHEDIIPSNQQKRLYAAKEQIFKAVQLSLNLDRKPTDYVHPFWVYWAQNAGDFQAFDVQSGFKYELILSNTDKNRLCTDLKELLNKGTTLDNDETHYMQMILASDCVDEKVKEDITPVAKNIKKEILKPLDGIYNKKIKGTEISKIKDFIKDGKQKENITQYSETNMPKFWTDSDEKDLDCDSEGISTKMCEAVDRIVCGLKLRPFGIYIKPNYSLIADEKDHQKKITVTELCANYLNAIGLVLKPLWSETLEIFAKKIKSDLKVAPVKTAARMVAKALEKVKEAKAKNKRIFLPPMFMLDVLRASIIVNSADELITAYNELLKDFDVLRVKNGFKPDGKAAYKKIILKVIFGTDKVQIISEIQLTTNDYFKSGALTHLYYNIERIDDIKAMQKDFAKLADASVVLYPREYT
eukprot:260495_1